MGEAKKEDEGEEEEEEEEASWPSFSAATKIISPPPTPRPLNSPGFSVSMSRSSAFFLVFVAGATVAVFSVLLSDFFRAARDRRVAVEQQQQHQAGLFPDSAHLAVVVEEDAVLNSHPAIDRDCRDTTSYYAHTELQRKKPSHVQNYKDCEAEALQTLHAALNSKGRHGVERAKKLFDHAVNLCPNHPRVLVYYGEFLEAAQEDYLEADHLFARALAFSERDSEEHSRALANRKRTASLVEELDRRTLKRIDDKKKVFHRVSENSSPMKRAKKEAYFQHIYHTIGIEGNTMTLAQTRSILETKLAVGGKSVVEHNEVLGMDAALRYINQTLVDRVGEITLKDILEIHKRVIGYVDPVEAGMMRRTQVFVGDYVPPHPSHIEVLMTKFISWLNTPENVEFHPINFAALAHYKLVYIHPFIDGNGRTSRLLMNLILMQSGFPPVIIRKQDRLPYYKHLVTANEGDIRPFIRFIAECTERTLDAYIAAATEHPKHKHFAGLMPFVDESETVISTEDHLDYHEAVVLGGAVGDNMRVEVEP